MLDLGFLLGLEYGGDFNVWSFLDVHVMVFCAEVGYRVGYDGVGGARHSCGRAGGKKRLIE